MADDERILKRMALQGIAPLDVDEAHEVMGLMLSLQQTQATVMDVDWRRMRSGPGGDASTLLEELAPARQQSQAGDSELVARLRKLRGAARRHPIDVHLRHKRRSHTIERGVAQRSERIQFVGAALVHGVHVDASARAHWPLLN